MDTSKNKPKVIECYICSEEYIKEHLTFDCGHSFDLNCVVQIQNGLCPLCRKKITGVPKYISTILEKNDEKRKETNQLNNRVKVCQREIKLLQSKNKQLSYEKLSLIEYIKGLEIKNHCFECNSQSYNLSYIPKDYNYKFY